MAHHILLVLDGFEGAPYKRVHIVQLYEGVPYARVAELAQASDLGSEFWGFESSHGYQSSCESARVFGSAFTARKTPRGDNR